jgi:hypothetical protein
MILSMLMSFVLTTQIAILVESYLKGPNIYVNSLFIPHYVRQVLQCTKLKCDPSIKIESMSHDSHNKRLHEQTQTGVLSLFQYEESANHTSSIIEAKLLKLKSDAVLQWLKLWAVFPPTRSA